MLPRNPAIQHRILLEEKELYGTTANIYSFIFCCDAESLHLALLSIADIKADSLTRYRCFSLSLPVREHNGSGHRSS